MSGYANPQNSAELSAQDAEAMADVRLSKATFAGGCFWCMESPFEELHGVKAAISGYAGGQVENPTYEQVCSGRTGHTECVQIYFDPAVISYAILLEAFWRQIDPTDAGGQFVDRGSQYRTAVFYHDEEQKRLAEVSRNLLSKSGVFSKPIVTEITPLEKFYRAEDYHQNFCRLNPGRYNGYRDHSGRDPFLEKTWQDEKEAPLQ